MGSSPLTRGKQNRASISMPSSGFIPAHAGKTTQLGATRTIRRAHPRSRGENPASMDGWSMLAGSSPLTRGKLVLPGVSARTRRLIPAHAGKTRG